jgi:hypothetical protein
MTKFVEHYELTERIKVVNGAAWWRGWDSKLERDVSIWTLSIDDPRVLKLKASAAAAANLHDPRVLRVLDLVANDQVFAVISEWVHGVTVAERVLGRAPLNNATEIINSLIECLTSTSQQEVYHGALTADDVVLTSGGIKIRGFGIAAVITEPFGITSQQADIAAIGAISYAAVTATWPLLTACSLPAAPSVNGLVVLPSQVTPKLPQIWDNLAQQTLPTINPTVDLNLPIAQLPQLLKPAGAKAKFANFPTVELPPSTISRRGLIGSLTTIALLLIAGSTLVFTSLINPDALNQPIDNQTGTDLRTELLPVAEISIIDSTGTAKLVKPNQNLVVSSDFGIQIKLKERRTVQRVELDLSVGGVDLVAQVSSTAIVNKSEVGLLGEVVEAASSAIIFGPRFVTGDYVTVWFSVPTGGSVQISRLSVYGNPS